MLESEEAKRRHEGVLEEDEADKWVERLRWLGIKVEKQTK